MTTLLNDLGTLDKTYGIESMCVAGGMGMAMLVERLSRRGWDGAALRGGLMAFSWSDQAGVTEIVGGPGSMRGLGYCCW
jgi:hypothetical protein